MKQKFKSFLILMLALICMFVFVACTTPDDPDNNGGGGGTGIETGAGSASGSSGNNTSGSSGSGTGNTPSASEFNLIDTWIYTGKVFLSDGYNRSYASMPEIIVFNQDNNGVYQLYSNTGELINQLSFTYSRRETGVNTSHPGINVDNFGEMSFEYVGDNVLRGSKNNNNSYFFYYERLSVASQPGYVPYVYPTQQAINKQQKEAFSGRWEATKYTENDIEKPYWRTTDILKVNPDGFYLSMTQSQQDQSPMTLSGFWTFDNNTITFVLDNATTSSFYMLENDQLVYTYVGGTGDICKVFYTKTMGYGNVSQANADFVGKWNMTDGTLSFGAISINLVALGMNFSYELFNDSTVQITATTDGVSAVYGGFWTVIDSSVFISVFDSFDDDLFVFEDGKLFASETLEQDGIIFEGTITFEKQAN